MNKIPVGETIVFAYTFVFVQVVTIVRVAALPAVLSSAIDYGMRRLSTAYSAELDAGDAAAGSLNLAVWLVGTVATIFLSAVATAGIARAALGLKGDHGPFPIGRTELRMFAAKLRFWIGVLALTIVAGVIAVVAFLLAGASLTAPPQGDVPPTAATFVAGLITWFLLAYVIMTALRMGFLLPATVVAEDKGGLQRSYDLARGNFWRLFLVVLALGGPVLLLLSLAGFAVLRASLGADYATILEQSSMSDLVHRGATAIEENLLAWEAFNAVIFMLASGLLYSGAAYAYRALTRESVRRA